MDYTDKVYFFIKLILDILFGIIILPLFVFRIRKLLLTNKISSDKITFLQTIGGKAKSKVLFGKIKVALFAILGIVLVPLSIYRIAYLKNSRYCVGYKVID